MRRARRLAELKTAPDALVWEDSEPSRCAHIWAPEFHRLMGENGPRWFLYYTASDAIDANHRMYVAESAGDDLRGPYAFKARLQTDPDNAHYAIDGTVLEKPNGELYFIWCGRPSDAGQGLYISRMANPWTLTGERVAIPASGFRCAVVREGPVTLQRNGRVFLFYSACGADTPDYKIGMLTADTHADPLDPHSWTQHTTPVFERADDCGVYGPGHHVFFQSPDAQEDWIVYHAKSGEADSYADRSTRAQPFTWNADGTPHLGRPPGAWHGHGRAVGRAR